MATTDNISIGAKININDIGTDQELLFPTNKTTIPDSGIAIEDVSLLTKLNVSDQGQGVDISKLSWVVQDTAHGEEIIGIVFLNRSHKGIPYQHVSFYPIKTPYSDTSKFSN